MRYIRVTASVESDRGTLFDLLANGEGVRAARATEWNLTDPEAPTFLYAIDGDAAWFEAAASELAGVERVEVATDEADPFFALVEAQPEAVDCVTRGIARGGLVVRRPIVYREGQVRGRVVGDLEPLQATMDAGPANVDVQIEEIGSYPGNIDRPTAALSERQREALEVALSVGYYATPREATHEDVATELGCAPATASTHLQKAEATLVRAVMDEFGPDV